MAYKKQTNKTKQNKKNGIDDWFGVTFMGSEYKK